MHAEDVKATCHTLLLLLQTTIATWTHSEWCAGGTKYVKIVEGAPDCFKPRMIITVCARMCREQHPTGRATLGFSGGLIQKVSALKHQQVA
jgi:hypothetical protein